MLETSTFCQKTQNTLTAHVIIKVQTPTDAHLFILFKKTEMRIDGPKIRRLRTHLHLSQEELAVEASVSRRTVQKTERSANGLSMKTVESIADVLNVDPSELLIDPDPLILCDLQLCCKFR